MTEKLLASLRQVSADQVRASREGDLTGLEDLERQRRQLVVQLEDGRLADLAGRQPDLVGELMREILANERLVKAALLQGMRRRQEKMSELDRRRRAERA